MVFKNTLGIISTKWKELIYSITSLSQPSVKQRFTQLLLGDYFNQVERTDLLNYQLKPAK